MGAVEVVVADAPVARPARKTASRSARRRSLCVAGVALVAVVGLVMRLYVLGRGAVTSDEAVVGLMAREILHGHFFAFYWGQSYGGTPEVFLVAAVVFLLGSSPFALGLAPLLLDAAAAVLVWRAGRYLVGPAAAVVAAAAFWLWPWVLLDQSVEEYGFRFATLVAGLVATLVVARWRAGRARGPDWLVLGAAAGLGWWSSPEVMYFLVPAGLVALSHLLARRRRVRARDAAVAVAAFALASLPWWWRNLGSGFPSLRAGPQPSFPGSPYVLHLRLFVTKTLPMMLGLKLPFTGDYAFDPPLARGCYAAALLLLVAGGATLLLRRRARWVVLALVCYPFLYALSPYAWYWQDGRYGIYLVPFLALFLGALGEEVAGALSRLVAQGAFLFAGLVRAAVVAGALALTVLSAVQSSPVALVRGTPAEDAAGPSTWSTWHLDPDFLLTRLAARLGRSPVRDYYASYWLAYDLGFFGGGRLVVTALPPNVRYEPYWHAVREASRAGWVFVRPADLAVVGLQTETAALEPGCVGPGEPCLDPSAFEAYLLREHDPYQVVVSGDFVVVVPSHQVRPLTVFLAFGLPYTS